MSFNPFNLFKGNPKVLELLSKNQSLQLLLSEQAFLSEFKKTQNQALQNYMNYQRYQQLIDYITIPNQELTNTNKSFRFPFVAAEILAVSNDTTFKYLLEEVVFFEEEIEEQIEFQRQIDSESSDRSRSSINSSNSCSSKKMYELNEDDKQNIEEGKEDDQKLNQFAFGDQKQICEQDFPDAKIKKRIQVRETIKKMVKKPLQPLIFRLLEYFQKPGAFHILDGYVCRALDNVLNNRFSMILTILRKYQRFDKIRAIFTHIESNSVQDTLFNFVDKLTQAEQLVIFDEQRTVVKIIQEMVLAPIDQNVSEGEFQNRAYVLSLYSLIIDKITSKINTKINDQKQQQQKPINLKVQLCLLAKIIHQQMLQQSIGILLYIIERYNQNNVFPSLTYQFARLLRLVVAVYSLLKNNNGKEGIEVEDKKQMKQLLQMCEQSFDKVIDIGLTFAFQDWLMLQEEQLRKYKPKHSLICKVELFQAVGMLAKQNIYFSRKTLIDHVLFDKIPSLMDIYPNSSIFHNSIAKIVCSVIGKDSDTATIDKFFGKNTLLLFLYETVKKDTQIRFQKKQLNRKCYIAQVAAICMAIDSLDNAESQPLAHYRQSYQWQYIKECLIEDQKGLQKKVLGGHSKIVEKKPIIFFTKQECLKHFTRFLSGTQFNHFDDFQNYEPGNSDNEQQKDGPILSFPQETDETVESTKSNEAVVAMDEDEGKYFAQDYVL